MRNNKLLIWTVVPNHYQRALFTALRNEGVDLKVCYYEPVPEDRLQLGWDNGSVLFDGEMQVPKTIAALDSIPDWKERIHIVPGCAERFLRDLIRILVRNKVDWVHWSEPSKPGLRRLFALPSRCLYARRINRYALGALGIGQRALDHFASWGVRPEKTAILPYSSAICAPGTSMDPEIKRFCNGRHPVFLFLGTLCHRKGIDILLRAFARLEFIQPIEPLLVLVGNDKSDGNYAKLAHALGIHKRVLFRGAMPPPELGTALHCGDVLCLTSRAEGWGVVLNEAASTGLAIIASEAVGAAYHLIEPGQNGFRTQTLDIESLRNAMQAYVNDPNLAKRHGTLSQHIFEDYTPQRNAQRLLTAIETFQAMQRYS
jgi:glycosyltransferase involved in cell wall biosynthesis